MSTNNQDTERTERKSETTVSDIAPHKDVTGGKGGQKLSKQANASGKSGSGKGGGASQHLH